VTVQTSHELLRFLLYSHDALGLGHVRRNLAIARALTTIEPSAAVLVASGSDEIDRLGRGHNIDALKLPGIEKRMDGTYAARRLPLDGRAIRSLRSAILAAAASSFAPTVIVADKHPLGMRGELSDALAVVRAAGGRCALGLRDILDDPAVVRREWEAYDLAQAIEARYDLVLVYGERAVFDLVRSYALPPAVAARARYCGYVATPGDGHDVVDDPVPPSRSQRRGPLVVATTGGGKDGRMLLDAFVDAAIGAGWEPVIVAGPQRDREIDEELRARAVAAGVSYHGFVGNLGRWFDAADAVVCMGGYNTVVETLSRGLPVVCVPRVTPRVEQQMRAQAFAALGLLRVLEPDSLTADGLRRAVCDAVADGRRRIDDCCLHFDGAERAAHHLLDLAAAPRTEDG
jgi:predicted glycosyltransferase